MTYPNTLCYSFCQWMLNVSEQKLTGPQSVIVQSISDAAENSTAVSDQEFYNFNLFTAWRYPYFVSWQNLQSAVFNPSANSIVSDWLNRLALAGAVRPSDTLINQVNVAVNYGVSKGLLSNTDFLFNFATDDVSQVLVPLIDNVGLSPTAVGSLGFVPGQGVFSSSNSYIRSSYIPSVSALNVSLNSFAVSAFAQTPSPFDGVVTGALSNSPNTLIRVIPRNSSNNLSFSLNDFSSGSFSNVSPVTQITISRPSSTLRYVNSGAGFVLSNTNSSVSLPTVELFILALNNAGTAQSFFTSPCSVVWIHANTSPNQYISTFLTLLVNN